jgi:hypothetical protein
MSRLEVVIFRLRIAMFQAMQNLILVRAKLSSGISHVITDYSKPQAVIMS